MPNTPVRAAAEGMPASLLEAVDWLNEAKHLVTAAQMAVADINDQREAGALDAVITAAMRRLEAGIEMIEDVRLGRVA